MTRKEDPNEYFLQSKYTRSDGWRLLRDAGLPPRKADFTRSDCKFRRELVSIIGQG